MLVGIHVHRDNEVAPFSNKYIEILKFNQIDYVILNINELDFWEKLTKVTHFIFHWGGSPDITQVAKSIIPVVENYLNIPVFPETRSTWHHDDKIRQYYLLSNLGFPIIKSWIFWNKKYAINWLKNEAVYPLVFKLKSSAASKDVVLVSNYRQAKKITNRIFGKGIYLGTIPGNFKLKFIDFKWRNYLDKQLKILYRIYKGRDLNYLWQIEKNYVLFQKFLPNNSYDTRVTIIGNRAFGFRRFNRKDDFRSSGSGLISYDPNEIDKGFIKMAFEISEKMGFQSMAYDFLWDNEQPAFCEISYTYQDLAIYNCPGYWDNKLNWIEGNFWPQLLHLIDLLNHPNLKQPPFEEMYKHKMKRIIK